MKKILLTFLAATLFSGSVWASGYQVLLQSNRSTAMGNIGVGLRPDPSSINFNPGALAMMRGNGVQVGANLIYSGIAYQPFESGQVYRTENPTGTPFHAFATFGAEESNLKFGLGVYTPYGSTVRWEDNWAGRFDLTQLSLQAIFVQPTVSYKINDQLSIGGGFIYSFGGVNLQRDIREVYLGGTDYGSAELDGSASGFGYNLGVYFEPTEKFSLGINYRSKVNMKVDKGTATFKTSPMVPSSLIPSQTGFTSELPLPSHLAIGLSFRPNNNFTIGADISRTGWGAYESLTFAYDDPVAGQTETVNPRNYKTSYAYRIGGEYAVIENFRLRAGAYFDETPVQEGYMTPESPDANTVGLTGGFGLNLGESFIVDASFLFINKQQRDNPPNTEAGNLPTGTYKSIALIPGLSLTYKF